MNTYSLDEAAAILSKQPNIAITARQIREHAIKGRIVLTFLFRGKVLNCETESEEDIYGWPYALPGHITEMEMRGKYPANMFVFNDTVYKITEPDFAVTLTPDNLLIDQRNLDQLAEILSGTKDESAKEPPLEMAQRRQERLILEAIKDLNYDPLNYPTRPAGYPGVKSEVKARVRAKHKADFRSQKVFDKAWDRLREYREIQSDGE